MFKELHAVARHTPLNLIITPAGEQLKVIVMPKPTGDAADNSALSKPLSFTATPEELDAEFPEALRKYAESVNELRTSIDLPLDALEAAKKKAGTKKQTAAERRAEKKKAKEDKAAAKRKTKEEAAAKKKADAEERAAAKKAKKDEAKGGSGKPAALPGANAAPSGGPALAKDWPFPLDSKGSKPPKPAKGARSEGVRADLPGKDACSKDYLELKEKHGDKLTRRLFIKKAETGRRYERLWNNWEAFLKEIKARSEKPAAAAPQRKTIPIMPAAETPAEDHLTDCGGCKNVVYTAPGGQAHNKSPHVRCKHFDLDIPLEVNAQGKILRSLIPSACPTFPDLPVRVRGTAPGIHTDVYDEAGVYLSSITTKPELGKHIGLVSQEYLLRIVAVDKRASGGLDVTVAPDPTETKRQAEAVAESVRQQNAAREAEEQRQKQSAEQKYSLVSESGAVIKTSKWPFTGGERLQLQVDGAERRFAIDRHDTADPHRSIAREILLHKKLLLSEGGDRLGDSEEIYIAGERADELPDGEFVVVEIRDGAYVVRNISAPPKPVWKVWNTAGEEIGAVDVEPKVGEKIDVGTHKGLTVIEVDDQDCTAAIVKPRIKGPAGATAPAA